MVLTSPPDKIEQIYALPDVPFFIDREKWHTVINYPSSPDNKDMEGS
jgi:hypothetical protein